MARFLLLLLILPSICASVNAQEDFLIKTRDFAADYVFISGRMFYYDERFNEITEVTYEGLNTDNNGYGYVKIDGKNRLYIKNAPVEIDPEKTVSEMAMPAYEFLKFNIKSITASSELTEKIGKSTSIYKPGNMISIYFQDAEEVMWKKDAAPWVEGKEDAGIGETIEIEFEEKTAGCMILNGFVDQNKKELYKNNNRFKRILVTSLDGDLKFNSEYEIPDFVHFFGVKFPNEANRVKITILDVYRGEKYNDTCITSIIGGDNSTEIESRIKEIKTELVKRGLIK